MSSYDVERAAEAIAAADGLICAAGAGMGVDSGLPDFRGDEGFWKAYPPFERLGVSFVDMANPEWFERDPELAWGFYGHRHHLYAATEPHDGFGILHRWSEEKELGAFVFTSNVDGHFQRAGFAERDVYEVHGSLRHLQCRDACTREIWSAEDVVVEVDEDTMRARPPLPSCPGCGGVARPNVLMFGDWSWIGHRSDDQANRFAQFLEAAHSDNLAIIECGAGTAVPTIRMNCERISMSPRVTLIRINPREPDAPADGISIESGALDALEAIDELL